MTHNLSFNYETTDDVVFLCLNCGKEIGFNKVGLGTPCAENVNGEWIHPENPETWMGNCE